MRHFILLIACVTVFFSAAGNVRAATANTDHSHDIIPLSTTEMDNIRNQFIPCWSMPAGAKDVRSLAVRVIIQFNTDGSVADATIANDQLIRYDEDAFFRAAATSVLRAIHKCSPITKLPPGNYNSWKVMELNFDPMDL